MRDFLLLFAPIFLIVYFLVYPDQFVAFLMWAQRLVG